MNRTIFDKIGLPKPLAWAYLGILIFMMGDGIEQGWLSPYLIGRGLSLEQSAGLFTMYGVTIAISAWFSGVLAEAYGVKRTMFAGLVLYLLGTCGFTRLPDSKKFRRDLSEERKSVFRSTIFPMDASLLKGSGIREFSEEISRIIRPQ